MDIVNNSKWKAMVKEVHEEYIEKTREFYKRKGDLINLEEFEKEIGDN